MKTTAIRATIAIIALLILGISLATANAGTPPTTPTNKSTSVNPNEATLTITATPIPYCWVDVPPANPGQGNVILSDIDSLASNDIWAVGAYEDDPPRSVAMHWDGAAWTNYPLPENTPAYKLTAVDMLTSNDVWAMAGHSPNNFANVFLHWNGTQWSVAAPGLSPDTDGFAVAIAAVAPDNLLVVSNGPCYKQCGSLYVNRWDGTQWSYQYSYGCDLPCGASSLYANSPNDIWIGGYGASNRELFGLLIHWDGTQWGRVRSPELDNTDRIYEVAGSAANDVWVAADQSLLHWNGSTWTSYTPEYYATSDMVAISPDDAWAVGDNTIRHWNGVQWGRSENAPGQTSVNAITAVSSNNIWAVGTSDLPDHHGMMITHYSSSCVSTPIPTPTITPTPEPPRCPGERFTDVCPTDYFYQHVLDLNDLGIITGYNSTPPCESSAHVPCFKPYNLVTRGQMAKIISNAAGFTEPAGAQQFEDVPPGSTFYDYVWRLADRNIVVGYACSLQPGEPCGPENRPYFRVGAEVNRAQLAKFAALAFGFEDTPAGQTFEDVVPANHFYLFIENLASRNIINGYPCGGLGEPCGADNLPYYRYGNLITRGQVTKIVNLARIQAIPTPTLTRTITSTSLPTNTPTPTGTPGSPTVTPTSPSR